MPAKLTALAAILWSSIAFCQWGPAQPLQPFRSNWIKAQAGGGYTYGYPACGTCAAESNVAAQWIFDESSGAVVDEVASLSVPTGGSGHSYGITSSGEYEGLSPGISPGASGWFRHTTDTSLGVSTNDYVFETWFTWYNLATYGDCTFFSTENTAGMAFTLVNNGNGRVHVQNKESGGAYIAVYSAIPSAISVGTMVNLRLIGDRSDNLDIVLQGTSIGTHSLKDLDGLPIPAQAVVIGANYPVSMWHFLGAFHEIRLTIGNITNCSGMGCP